MRGSRVKQLAEEAELEQKFLNDPAAVDPFIALSAMVIAASDCLEAFYKGDFSQRAILMDYMDRIKAEADNVKVEVTMKHVRRG